jgi:hypothetical protein
MDGAADRAGVVKKPYVRPALVRYGNFVSITKAKGAGSGDGQGGGLSKPGMS